MNEFDAALEIINKMINDGDLDLGYEPEIYAAYACVIGLDPEEVDEWSEEAEDAYIGEYDNDTDFAYEYSSGVWDIPQHLEPYIDWSSVASDLMHDVRSDNNMYFHTY